MKTSEQKLSLQKSGPEIHIKINPWPFLWTVVGAWMWFGILHLAPHSVKLLRSLFLLPYLTPISPAERPQSSCEQHLTLFASVLRLLLARS
jgi:hypothetical protein